VMYGPSRWLDARLTVALQAAAMARMAMLVWFLRMLLSLMCGGRDSAQDGYGRFPPLDSPPGTAHEKQSASHET
jgi:hypothetical protein